MKEYLDSLKRQQLIKIYTKFGLDSETKTNILKTKNDILKQLILDEELVTKDIAEEFLLNKNSDSVKELDALVDGVKEYNSKPTIEVLDEDKNPAIIVAKAVTKSRQHLQELATEMKKEAMKMLIATIQTRYARDVEAGKKCETIYFANQYFSVAKVVPFGVKCALPKCIVQIAQEAKAPVYREFDSFEQKRKAGRMGNYVLEPKYDVMIHGTLEEYEASEDKKRELGL